MKKRGNLIVKLMVIFLALLIYILPVTSQCGGPGEPPCLDTGGDEEQFDPNDPASFDQIENPTADQLSQLPASEQTEARFGKLSDDDRKGWYSDNPKDIGKFRNQFSTDNNLGPNSNLLSNAPYSFDGTTLSIDGTDFSFNINDYSGSDLVINPDFSVVVDNHKFGGPGAVTKDENQNMVVDKFDSYNYQDTMIQGATDFRYDGTGYHIGHADTVILDGSFMTDIYNLDSTPTNVDIESAKKLIADGMKVEDVKDIHVTKEGRVIVKLDLESNKDNNTLILKQHKDSRGDGIKTTLNKDQFIDVDYNFLITDTTSRQSKLLNKKVTRIKISKKVTIYIPAEAAEEEPTISFTSEEDTSSITYTVDHPPTYQVTDGTLTYESQTRTETIISEQSSIAEISREAGINCFILTPKASYEHKSKVDKQRSFGHTNIGEEEYKICSKKNTDDIIEQDTPYFGIDNHLTYTFTMYNDGITYDRATFRTSQESETQYKNTKAIFNQNFESFDINNIVTMMSRDKTYLDEVNITNPLNLNTMLRSGSLNLVETKDTSLVTFNDYIYPEILKGATYTTPYDNLNINENNVLIDKNIRITPKESIEANIFISDIAAHSKHLSDIGALR